MDSERRERGQKVAFDAGTWVKMVGLVLTMIGLGAGLAAYTFQTQAAAHREAAVILRQANAYTDKEVAEIRTSVTEDVGRLERNQRAMLKRLEVIGDRMGRGAGAAVRAVRPMEIPE